MKYLDKVYFAILKINPNAKYSILGENLDNITWVDTTPISKADIEAKMVEVQADYDAKQYQRDRATAYPSMADQLDDIYHNGIDAWKATIKTIKDKYPKE